MSWNRAVASAGSGVKTMFIMMMLLMSAVMSAESQGMGTCPVTSPVSVSLSSSYEQDGRAFACPGEHVTFFCEVNGSATVQIAAEPFICLADPVVYVLTDPVGRTGPTGANLFQANLTDVQRQSSLMAYYNTTLTTTVTSETGRTTVECSNQLTSSSSVQRNLTQSQTPAPPPGLNHRLMSRDCTCDLPDDGSTSITCTCRTADLLLFWEAASGKFDVECYVVTALRTDAAPPPVSPDMCNMRSSSICMKATVSTNLDFPACISPGVNYTVRVWTVSRCGEVSSPAVVLDVHVDEHLAMVELPGPITIIAPLLTVSNIVLTGIGGSLLTLATVVSLCRLCLIDLQERLLKCLIAFERLLRGISLLMVVITVFLLLLNLNEPCDEACLVTHNATTSLFFIFALISTVVTMVITCFKCYKYKYKTSNVFQLHHPKYFKLQTQEEARIPTDSGSARIATDSGSPKHGFTSDQGMLGLHELKIEKTTHGQMLVVVQVQAKETGPVGVPVEETGQAEETDQSDAC